MKSKLAGAIFAAVLSCAFSAGSANAATFSWSYLGFQCGICFGSPLDVGSGTLTTGALVGPSAFLITDVTGTWNGFTITGIIPPFPDPSSIGNNNVLYLSPNPGPFDEFGLAFLNSANQI